MGLIEKLKEIAGALSSYKTRYESCKAELEVCKHRIEELQREIAEASRIADEILEWLG